MRIEDGFAHAMLVARTVSRLHWRQIVFRPLRRIQRVIPPYLPRSTEPFDEEALQRFRTVASAWVGEPDDRVVERAEAVAAAQFRFLNHAESLSSIDWCRRYVSHLWNYHLHYFEYAVDLAAAYRWSQDDRFREAFERLAGSWIDGAPPGHGDGWEPYALSQRIIHWSLALILFGGALTTAVRERLRGSLGAQLAFLEKRLEWHVLANHLQKNFAALAVGGLLFRGPRAARWRRRGVGGMQAALQAQVLPDGGHYERSPMYHACALADHLLLVALLRSVGAIPPSRISRRLVRMLAAYGSFSRSDGTLHLFNDSANGAAPSRATIARLASLLGEEIREANGLVALPQTGYFGWIDRPAGDRVIIDCGEPGAPYQPGHAHCDALSYELDLSGRPVVVDSGVHGYGGDPLREYVRSTRAHNTVMIGGREQSEVWGTFRLARRVRILGAAQEHDGGAYRFSGGCGPFHDPRAAHWRAVSWRERTMRVEDRVEGAHGARIASFVHLHPAFRVERAGDAFVAVSSDLTVRIETFGVDDVAIRVGEREPAQGWYCPEFGVAIPAPVLELVVAANDERMFGYVIREVERR
ncbi:MAG TPA: alginate lyase family protein [Longimicrobiales bacterium]